MKIDGRREELGRFLKDRRSRVRPKDVGLPEGPNRRVSGLRREEVATLAGLGVTWYTMLENGTAPGVSLATLTSIGKALNLSPGEIVYLHLLADERPAETPQAEPSEVTRGALAAIESAPAYVCTSQWTVLAWNRAMSIVWGLEPPGGRPFNIVSRTFRDPAVRAMHGERFADFSRVLVAMVRSTKASRYDDSEYRRMCEELRTDPLFAATWDAYDVAMPLSSVATEIDSAAVGPFSFRSLTLEVPDDVGHWIVIQVPDAPSAAKLHAALQTQ